MINLSQKPINIVVGHYGSGKSEFSVNYAIALAVEGHKTAIVDLDIANPYFRSREKQSLMESKGISVYSNTFGYDITADLPAISAGIKAPLEDNTYRTVLDVGGNAEGARILNQFSKYFSRDIPGEGFAIGKNTDIFCVINGNRYETRTLDTAIGHIHSIEQEIHLKVTGLINNTHMLRETTCADVLKGYYLCLEMGKILQVPLICNCCKVDLVEELEREVGALTNLKDFNIFPINMILREEWQ